MAKRKIAPRFYILLGAIIIIAAIAAFFLFFKESTYADMKQGTIKFEQTENTIIVRDEKVIEAENYGKITFNVSEGDSIKKNDKIAELFKWGYKDTVMQDLVSTQSDIIAYQRDNILKGSLDVELTNKNQSILDKLAEIKKVINGEKDGDLSALYAKLQTLLDERKALFKSKVQANVDSKLTTLYEKEKAAIERIDGWKTELKADGDGIVSFYFDGFEDILKPSNIDSLTLKDITTVMNSSTTSVQSDSNIQPIYRLISGNWYCIFVIENAPSYYYAKDQQFDITFEGYYDKPFTGKVVSVRKLDDNNTIFAVQMNEAIGSLISIRNINASFKANYSGYTVPVSAINKKDDTTGIYIKSGDDNVFVPVEIIMEDNDNAIVKATDNTSFSEGVKVLVK